MHIFRTLAVLGATTAAVGAAVLVPSTAQAATVIGIQYQHSNYGGSRWTHSITSNGFTCTGTVGDTDAEQASTPAGWNDIVSSFQNFSNCWTKIYEHNNFGGSSYGYTSSTGYVGDAMNDRTSSVRWS